MTTRVLLPNDLALYKRLRLAALQTDPDAFGSNYAREIEFDNATWLSRMSGFDGRVGVVFVDEVDGEPTGIVGIGFSERPADTQLWGMWVAPESRRTGAAQRLVGAAIKRSNEQSAKTVTLWWSARTPQRLPFMNATSSTPPAKSTHSQPTPASPSLRCNECSRSLLLREKVDQQRPVGICVPGSVLVKAQDNARAST
jgi:GNAT superfamily N-acetyltransferase